MLNRFLAQPFILAALLFIATPASAQLAWDQSVVEQLWEKELLIKGAQIGGAGTTSVVQLNETYYDMLHTYLSTIQYCDKLTADHSPRECEQSSGGVYNRQNWIAMALKAKVAYHDHFAPDYTTSGYWRFTDGLLLAKTLTESDSTLAAVTLPNDVLINMRDNPAYSRKSEFTRNDLVFSSGLSRELSYALEAHINAEKSGQPRDSTRVDLLVNALMHDFDLWRAIPNTVNLNYTTLDGTKTWSITNSAPVLKPFMTGLAAKALLTFYDWELENNRLSQHSVTENIPDVLSDFYLFLYNDAKTRDGTNRNMWMAAGGGFSYIDTAAEGGVRPTPDLNMIIAPAYAWLARHYHIKHTKNPSSGYGLKSSELLRIGDDIFMNGMYKRYIAQGKQFNQYFRWSFDYFDYRSLSYNDSPASPPIEESPPSVVPQFSVQLIPTE